LIEACQRRTVHCESLIQQTNRTYTISTNPQASKDRGAIGCGLSSASMPVAMLVSKREDIFSLATRRLLTHE
jgi:hypothetical protein